MIRSSVFSISLVVFCFKFLSAQTDFVYKRDFKVILEQTKDPKHPYFYDTLLKRFHANRDSTMMNRDMLALMIGFTDKPDFKPYDVVLTERYIYQLNDDGKFKEAYDTASKFLKVYPLSFQGLKEMAYTMEKLGKEDSSIYYSDLVGRMVSAMVYSGKGLTRENAMFALGPADGQHFLRTIGFGIGTMGSGMDDDGYFLDILQAKKDDFSFEMYFNIQHAVRKMFGGKSVEEMMKENTPEPDSKKSKKKKRKKS